MISIVIPAFNAEATVPNLIEDFLGQTYDDIEIICVDDGSDDNTFACAEGFARHNAAVRAISIEHGGPAAARGAGVDAARGEWIIFADADDRVWPTWIESLVEGARQVDPRGEADIVAGASCWNRSLVRPGWSDLSDGDPWPDYRGLFRAGQQMDEVWERMLSLPGSTASISHSLCDKLFRTELAHRAMRGMDRSFRIGEDTCFNIVAFCQARAVALTYAGGLPMVADIRVAEPFVQRVCATRLPVGVLSPSENCSGTATKGVPPSFGAVGCDVSSSRGCGTVWTTNGP